MKRKDYPPIEVDTLDQKLLYDILHELEYQRRTVRAMNRTVQFIGFLVFVTALLAVVGWFLG